MFTDPEMSFVEPERRLACHCSECGNEIYEGDFFYRIRALHICESCMKISLEVADADEVD